MKKHNKNKKEKFTFTQSLIIFIICFLFILVIGYLIFSAINTDENITKSKIENLASNYYENFLYQQIVDSGNTKPSTVLEEYNNIGLSVVYLRQLLLHEKQNDPETFNYLMEHCDENKTSVKFYPEPPYEKKSYRVDYTYSCDF